MFNHFSKQVHSTEIQAQDELVLVYHGFIDTHLSPGLLLVFKHNTEQFTPQTTEAMAHTN